MADIQITWNPAIGKGDWVVTLPTVTQKPVTVSALQQFAIGDGVSAQFPLVPSQNGISNVLANIYRTDWQGTQLLYATPRTNQIANSSQVGGSLWTNAGTVVTQNYGAAPDGSNTATLLAAQTAGSTAFVHPAAAQTIATGSNIPASLWVKAGTSTFSVIRIYNSAISTQIAAVYLTWASGVPSLQSTAGSIVSGSVSTTAALASGWYLVQFQFASGTNSAAQYLIYPDGNNGTASVEAWGPMLGAAGAYIPTTTAPVTMTDYMLAANGEVTLAQVPAEGAVLSWAGSYLLNLVQQGGFLQMGGDLDNAVLISLCTDRIAEPTDAIPDSSNDPRGWWGDAYGDPNYPIGSRLWLLRRAKQTQQTLQLAYDYISEALQWLLDDGVVASFDINVQWVANGQLGAVIVGYKQDGTVVTQNTFNWVWNGIA